MNLFDQLVTTALQRFLPPQQAANTLAQEHLWPFLTQLLGDILKHL